MRCSSLTVASETLNEQADGLGNKWKCKLQAANQTPVLLAEQQGTIQNPTGLLLAGEA